MVPLLSTCFALLIQVIRRACGSKGALVAENLFLRRNLDSIRSGRDPVAAHAPQPSPFLVIASRRRPYSADCIMSIVSRKLPHIDQPPNLSISGGQLVLQRHFQRNAC